MHESSSKSYSEICAKLSSQVLKQMSAWLLYVYGLYFFLLMITYWQYLFKYFVLCETYISQIEEGKHILNIFIQIADIRVSLNKW
jgi:hypothetical protein